MRSAMILLAFSAASCAATDGHTTGTAPSSGPATAELAQRASSAYGAFQELLGVVDRTGSVVLRRFRCERVRVPGAANDHVRALLDLAVAGSDSIEATRAFNRLESAVRANAWCLDFQAASTKVLPEDRGILSEGVVVLVDSSAIPAGAAEPSAAPGRDRKTVLVHARQAAAQASVGQIDCLMRTINPERGVEDTVYRFLPAGGEAGRRLDDLRGFFRRLDAFSDGEITSIDLVPANKQPPGTEPVDSWVFKVELTTRTG